MEYDLDTLDYLGKGGFGEVYGLNQHRAIKVIHVGRDVQLRNETLKEIRFMLDLKMMLV
jgi:predicted Ser/Thr protein kinase